MRTRERAHSPARFKHTFFFFFFNPHQHRPYAYGEILNTFLLGILITEFCLGRLKLNFVCVLRTRGTGPVCPWGHPALAAEPLGQSDRRVGRWPSSECRAPAVRPCCRGRACARVRACACVCVLGVESWEHLAAAGEAGRGWETREPLRGTAAPGSAGAEAPGGGRAPHGCGRPALPPRLPPHGSAERATETARKARLGFQLRCRVPPCGASGPLLWLLSVVLLLGTGKQCWPGSCDRGSASPWAWGWPCVWFHGPRPPILVPLDRLLMPGLVQRMPVSPLPAAGRGAEHGSDWGLLEGCSGCRRRTTWFGQADVGSTPGSAGYSLLLFDLISSTASTSHKPQISGRWIITCMGKQKF